MLSSSSSLFSSPVVVAAFGEGLCGGTDGRREGGREQPCGMDGGGGGVCEEEVSNVLTRFGTSAGDYSSSSFPIWVGGFGGGFGGHARGGG